MCRVVNFHLELMNKTKLTRIESHILVFGIQPKIPVLKPITSNEDNQRDTNI